MLGYVLRFFPAVPLSQGQPLHAPGRIRSEGVAADGTDRVLVPPAQLGPEGGLPGGLDLLRVGECEEAGGGGGALDPPHVRRVSTVSLDTAESQLPRLRRFDVREGLVAAALVETIQGNPVAL